MKNTIDTNTSWPPICSTSDLRRQIHSSPNRPATHLTRTQNQIQKRIQTCQSCQTQTITHQVKHRLRSSPRNQYLAIWSSHSRYARRKPHSRSPIQCQGQCYWTVRRRNCSFRDRAQMERTLPPDQSFRHQHHYATNWWTAPQTNETIQSSNTSETRCVSYARPVLLNTKSAINSTKVFHFYGNLPWLHLTHAVPMI